MPVRLAVRVGRKGRDWPFAAWRRFGFESTKRAQKYRRSAAIRSTVEGLMKI
jgi:hypothetical protein